MKGGEAEQASVVYIYMKHHVNHTTGSLLSQWNNHMYARAHTAMVIIISHI
jgi:hypothetical protein